MKPKTYLVTGCAGFIGSHLCAHLLKYNCKVVGIDNLSESVSLKARRLAILRKQEGFEFYNLDVTGSLFTIENRLAHYNFEACFHLAGKPGVNSSVEKTLITCHENYMGTAKVLEICKRLEIPKFIFASTSCVYSEYAPIPTKEIDSVQYPMQPYGASKRAAELLAYTYHANYGIDVAILRYFTVYGPWGRPDMAVHKFIDKIYHDKPIWIWKGEEQRSRGYTYVSDIIEGTVSALRLGGYQIFNLGGSVGINIEDMAVIIGRLMGKVTEFKEVERDPIYNKIDSINTLAETTKARKILDWQPKVSMSVGLKKTIDWYKAEWAV